MAFVAAVGMAIFQTITFKRRKQQNDFDSYLFIKFGINCCSTLGTMLFGSAAILTIYIYFVYKTQYVVQVLPPFSELRMIKCFFILAFVLKVNCHFTGRIRVQNLIDSFYFLQMVKFGHLLGQQINCDIFFIDWERPKVFEHQITLKSTNNLDTPSICSSVSWNWKKIPN